MHAIYIRMKDQEYQALKLDAQDMGLTVNGLVRLLIAQWLNGFEIKRDKAARLRITDKFLADIEAEAKRTNKGISRIQD